MESQSILEQEGYLDQRGASCHSFHGFQPNHRWKVYGSIEGVC